MRGSLVVSVHLAVPFRECWWPGLSSVTVPKMAVMSQVSTPENTVTGP
jgi:hypothetical protein